MDAVDIAALAQKLREELAAADAPAAAQLASVSSIVIAAVGELTRNVSPTDYDPQHVSIGPYHRLTSPQFARNDEKLRSLGAVMSAASATPAALEDCLGELARLEGDARNCYAHGFPMDSSEFVRMLLLDACYVLVRLGRVARRRGNGGGDGGAPMANGHVQGGLPSNCGSEAPSVVGGDMMEAVAVVRDVLYLAENQIPFFVIDEVHRLFFPDAGGVSAADAIAGYVRELLQGQQYSVATPAVAAPPPGNLLHLLHMHLTPTALPSPTTKSTIGGKRRRVGRWRSATEYYCAGVGFRARRLGRKDTLSILDVKLDGGTLEIPRLSVDAETPRLLRNLMALEQSNPAAAGSHVTAYCVFVSQLACTARDVELLSRRGVISHGLGSHDEVAGMLAGLCRGVAFGADDPAGNYLGATWLAMEGRFQSRPRRWAAWLMLKYFTNPWLAVGLAAAAVGLVCTVVQSVYSVLSYSPGGT